MTSALIELAAKRVEYYRMTHGQPRALSRHQLNRKWGHTVARGWASLILDHLRDYVRYPDDNHRRSREAHGNEAHEQFGFLTLLMQGKGQTSRIIIPALPNPNLILHFTLVLVAIELVLTPGSSEK